MTERDHFAANLPSDEIRELMYNSLSRSAKERLTGVKAPVKEDFKDIVEFQLAELGFHCAVNAAVRFKLADAMVVERLR